MRRFFALTLFVLLVLPGITLAAPATKTTAHAAASAHAAVVPDAQIESSIRAKLAKAKIGKEGFRFKVSHGVVTWEGTTGVVQHKGSATRMAKSAGATQVINNIQVTDAGKAKAAAGLKRAAIQ